MRALLNSLGLSLWWATAIILAAGMALVGYRVSLGLKTPALIFPNASPARPLEAVTPRGSVSANAGDAVARAPGLSAGLTRPAPARFPSTSPSLDGDLEGAQSAVPSQDARAALNDPNAARQSVTDFDRRPIYRYTEDRRPLSRAAAKEMGEAQKRLQASQWADALDSLRAAQARPGITAFDEFVIYRDQAIAYYKLDNATEAAAAFEKALGTEQATSEESQQLTRSLFGIAANSGQYQKAIDYGKQMIDNGTANNDVYVIIAQSYYQLKDCKSTVAAADRAIAFEKKQGQTPKENLYQFKLQCASDAGDQAAMEAVLVDLVKLTNSTKYWNPLLRIERQEERDDHNTLMIYRIMYNTNSMNQDTDYIEMAQLLGDAALPGEAAAVLNKAMSSNLMKEEHKERTERLLKSLQDRADTDKKRLPQEEAEAGKSANGEPSVKLGEVYYGFGDYRKAADAIMDGITRGSVRNLGDAYVYLGLADAQLNDDAGARDAFAILERVPDVSPRILKLWRAYAARLDGVSAGEAPLRSVASGSAWIEGKDYQRVAQPQSTSLPAGQVLVTEFFSYACQHCAAFEPYMRRLVDGLPPNAVVDYAVPSWNPKEGWPMFQLADATARELGVADAARAALFDSVWNHGDLALTDRTTGLARVPTIEDVARLCQAQGLVPAAKFLDASRSFAVQQQVRRDDSLTRAYGIDRVPTIVVNGKYRVNAQSAGSSERLIELVNYLVEKESGAGNTG
jgi:protein dithiol oxidoreductase (disulfide-forming)